MSLFGGKSKSKTTGDKDVMKAIKSEGGLLDTTIAFGDEYSDGSGLYTGSVLGAEDPLVRAGQDQALDVAGNYGAQYKPVVNALEGFLNYDGSSPENMASRAAVRDEQMYNWQNNIAPNIFDAGTSSGQFGGPQQNLALGASTAGMSRAIADNEARMMEADKNRKFNAMGQASAILNGQFLPAEVTSAIGDQRTQRGQMELMDTITQAEQPYLNQREALADIQNRMQGLAGLSSTTTSSTSTSPLSVAAGLGMAYLGGGGTLGALFGATGDAAGGAEG